MAAALVGGAFLSATLQVLFDRLASKEIVDFIRGKKLSYKVMNKLKVTLYSVYTVLDDAEKKQIHVPAVKKWVNELKDAAFDADDVLDEIATKAKTNSSGKISNFVPIPVSPYYRNLENRLEEILERLEFIAKQKDVLGLKEMGNHSNVMSQTVPTTSLAEEVYGREKDKRVIMELLLQDENSSSVNNNIDVIPIVGLGGVGKTTLAQVVYNDDTMEGYFDLKAWVHVSQEFNVFRVTKTILESTSSYAYDIDDLNLLQLELKEKLLRKKFLLVLDDVWNARYETWDLLRRPLDYGAQGSKIIVTTRHASVAEKMGTVNTYFLKELPDEICGLIFAKHALQHGSSRGDPVFRALSWEIAKKCRGLPLAAKALGGLLRSKPSVDDWKKILKSEIWDFSDDELGIIPALKLSYYYLPSHLKRCFAYCSIFPKGYVYDKEQIILLWMAENFLETSNQSRTIEEAGDEYFSELVTRSFFQKASFHKSRFVMHDLINDLAKAVSGEFCSKLEGENSPSFMDKKRHLSFVRDNYLLNLSDVLDKAKRLRTFLSLNMLWPYLASTSQKVPVDHLTMLRCLRVLSLNDCYEIKELPQKIGNLIHLRYLDVSRTAITELPKSTCNLYNLQTLKASKCASLRKLPENLHHLVNLRYLDTTGTPLKEMPRKISKLENLQMLSTFVVGENKESTIQELKEFTTLWGSLSIHKLQNIVGAADAMNARMEHKKFIKELKLNWDGTVGLKDPQREISVLENLRPHTDLKELTLHCYRGTRFPNWLGDLSFHNMASISLNSCRFCNFLPPLGQLPSLKVLEILQFDELTTIGDEFYGSSMFKPFPSLEILKFIYLPAWTKWHSLQDESFPRLRELTIENCPSLRNDLPRQLPAMTKLVILDCQELSSSLPKAPTIQQLEIINSEKVFLDEVPNNLQSLKIKGCQIMQSMFKSMEHTQAHLQTLDISACSHDISFPQANLYPSLRKLIVQNCKKLVIPTDQPNTTIEWSSISESCESLSTFPVSIFPNLGYLFLKDCKALSSLSLSQDSAQLIPNLYSLSIINCSAFVSFSTEQFFATNLTHLSVSGCESLVSLPKDMDICLPYLQTLIVYKCPKLESFSGGCIPSSLNTLHVANCEKLIANRSDWNLQRLKNLEILGISGTCNNVETFPDDVLLPSSVKELFIDGFVHLKTLNSKGLLHLKSLSELSISTCPQIKSLPEERLFNSLTFLTISGCPLLNQRCRKNIGEDWPKIAHIPFINIDGKHF